MNEAEEILKAMWDYNGGDFTIDTPDRWTVECRFCGKERKKGQLIHAADCVILRLETFAAQQGWKK